MKTNVLELSMEMTETEEGFALGFEGGLIGRVAKITTEEEKNEIRSLTKRVTEIINEAIVRDYKEGLEKHIEEQAEREEAIKELYDMLPEEGKKRVDDFERKLKELKSPKEKLELTMEAMLGRLLDLIEEEGE